MNDQGLEVLGTHDGAAPSPSGGSVTVVDQGGEEDSPFAGLADGQNAALGGGEVTESLRCSRRS